MSLWLLLVVLLPPLLFASTNLIDRILVGEYKPGSLMAVCGLFNLAASFGVWVWFGITNTAPVIVMGLPWAILVLNGVIYTVAIWTYLVVMEKEEASRVVPFYQTIPLYGLVGGYILLGESLGWSALLAVMFLVVGGVILSIKNGSVNKKLAFLMLISSGLVAANDVVLAYFGRQIVDTTGSVSLVLSLDLFGKALFGLLFLLNKKYRDEFSRGLKSAFILQASNEILFIAGDMIFDYAKIIAPVAIVQAACCSQPLFVIALVFFAGNILPKSLKEDFGGMKKWQKIIGVIAMVAGGIILSV